MESPFEPFFESNPFEGKATCCFTGHRPAGLPPAGSDGMALLRLVLMQAICAAYAGGVRTFLTGGAQGFDQMAAEAVLLQKGNWPEVRLLLALPSPTQADRWRADAQRRYEDVLCRADAVWYASDTAGAAAMHRRNRYLVDHADCCIAYLQKPAGGTFYTVRYALEKGLYIHNLAQFCQK